MRIIQTTNSSQNFRIFQVSASHLSKTDFAIRRLAAEPTVNSQQTTPEDIETIKKNMVGILSQKEDVFSKTIHELLLGMGTQDFSNNMNPKQLEEAAKKWVEKLKIGSLTILDPKPRLSDKLAFQKELIKIQTSFINPSPRNQVVLRLISNQLELIKKAFLSLSTQDQDIIKEFFTKDPIFSAEAINLELEKIQQETSKEAEPELNTNKIAREIKDFFIKSSTSDTGNYNTYFFDDIVLAAGVYARNRAGREDINEQTIANAARALNAVLKQIQIGQADGIDEKTLQKNILETLSPLDKNWPNWKNEIIQLKIAHKNSCLALLAKWFGNRTEDKLWLTPQQVIRIRLEFFNKVASQIITQIQSAEQTACKSPATQTHQPCVGYPKLLGQMNDINAFSNPGNVAACFDDKSGKKWFSPGSIELARMTVKKCTSFHPDVTIDDHMIERIVNALIQNVARWGSFKVGDKNQPIFDMRGVPEEQKGNQGADQQSQQNQPNQPNQQNQPTLPTQPAQPTQPTQPTPPANQPEESNVSVWANPEAILFASQIMMILTQGSTGNR